MGEDSTSTEEKKTNGKPPVESWPTAASAARLLGVKVQAVSQMVQRGELHPVADKDGTNRYDPAEVEMFKPDPAVLAAAAAERQAASAHQVTIIEELTATLKMTTEAMQKYLRLIPEPMLEVHKQQTRIIERQASRIEKLESQQIEMHDALGDMMRAREEQVAAKEESKRKQDRLDKCADALVDHAPKLVQDLIFGADLRRLIDHMDPQKLDALLDVPEMLDEQERGVITKLRDKMKARREEQAKAVAKRSETNEKPSNEKPEEVTTEGSEVTP